MGRLIPAGTGLAYHEARRQAREEWDLSGEQVEAQLAEALLGEAESSAKSEEVEAPAED